MKKKLSFQQIKIATINEDAVMGGSLRAEGDTGSPYSCLDTIQPEPCQCTYGKPHKCIGQG